MDIGILAARNQIAQERLLVAATALGKAHGLTEHVATLDAATKVKEKDVARLYEREALVLLLEGLLCSQPTAPTPPPAPTPRAAPPAASPYRAPAAMRAQRATANRRGR